MQASAVQVGQVMGCKATDTGRSPDNLAAQTTKRRAKARVMLALSVQAFAKQGLIRTYR